MITIEKDIPRKKRSGPKTSEKYLEIFSTMSKMEIGDSFLLPVHTRVLAGLITKQGNSLNQRFVTIRTEDGSMRVWRAELKSPSSPKMGRRKNSVMKNSAENQDLDSEKEVPF